MKKDLLQQVLLQQIIKKKKKKALSQQKKKIWGNIYTIASVSFFFFFCNSNLNVLHQFKIVARITLLHLNVLL